MAFFPLPCAGWAAKESRRVAVELISPMMIHVLFIGSEFLKRILSAVSPADIRIGIVTAALLAGACVAPHFGNAFIVSIERLGSRLARKKGLAIAAIATSAILLRLALLPWAPI